VPTSANSHIAAPSARDWRTAPVRTGASGSGREPSTAEEKPKTVPSAATWKTSTCSTGTPSEPTVFSVVEVTSYSPGGGSTALGNASWVCSTTSPVPSAATSTSHTRCRSTEYTTRLPV